MRLVHDDLVRQPGAPPLGREERQHRAEIVLLLARAQPREIDHDRLGRMAQRVEHLARRRRRIVAAEDGHVRQPLQAAVVPLRVEDGERVALEDELLAHQPGQQRLPRAGLAGDDHRAAPDAPA